MRLGSLLLLAALVISGAAPLSNAQDGTAADKAAPRIDTVSPDGVPVSPAPVSVTLNGRLFAKGAVVRARVKGERGGGIDLETIFEGPAQVRATLTVPLVAKAATLELRVKNPDGAVSDWVALEVRAAVAVPTPAISRVSPVEVKAAGRDVYVTAIGRDLVDQAIVTLSSSAGKSETRGHAVRDGLTFKVPDAHLALPGAVTFTITNPGGKASEPARFDVVAASPGGGNEGVSIVSVVPERIDLRTAVSASIRISAKGVELGSARVLLRREGDGSDGKIIPQTSRTENAGLSELTVTITKAMVREPGNYEVRIINGDGNQSTWMRIVVAGGGAPIGGPEAVVLAVLPGSVTLTSQSASVPAEISVRNAGSSPIRVTNFRVLTPDGAVAKLDGLLTVERGGAGQTRLSIPVPLGVGDANKGDAMVSLALAWSVSATSGRGPAVEGRYPEKDFAGVSVRNQIARQPIAREFVAATTAGAAGGWRFFKPASNEPADAAKAADFSLFVEPFGDAAGIKTVELHNYRPGDTDRGLFFLTLTSAEKAPGDPRTARERGARLGYLVTDARTGLVPLYRWALSDGKRVVNHYLTIEKDAAKLPRNMQRKGWKLDATVGYVVPAIP